MKGTKLEIIRVEIAAPLLDNMSFIHSDTDYLVCEFLLCPKLVPSPVIQQEFQADNNKLIEPVSDVLNAGWILCAAL